MSERVHVDLVCDEIITPQMSITFDVPEEADSSELGRYVTVLGVDGAVRATRRANQFRWSPPDTIEPGHYRFVLEALTDARSQKLTETLECPFTVIDTKAKIPTRLRIESFSRVRYPGSGKAERLRLGLAPRGNYIEFFKAVDRESGKPVELAFDQDGAEVASDAVMEEFRRQAYEPFGKIAPPLFQCVRDANDGDAILVDIWLALDEPDPSPSDRPLHASEHEYVAQRATETRRAWLVAGQRLARELAELGTVRAINELAPVITLETSAAAIRQLADDPRIAALLLHEEEGIDDLQDSIAIAHSGSVHAAGETGTGIRVAVWENGPTSDDDLVIAGRFRTDPTVSNHSQLVHAIIRNDEEDAPHGHAPGCHLYSANDKRRAALAWAVKDQDCTIVNQSFHRSTEPESDSLSSDDRYGDWLALHWPYPLIVHAAGNFWSDDPDDIDPPRDEFVNHKGYNTLSVGNHNDDADAMSGTSVFNNPASPHGDRELPEISANGTTVTATSLTSSGTSFASPAVAGVAALVQGTAPILEHWPEGCRAILMAGATRNVRGDTWWRDVVAGRDARDGVGAVHASEACAIARNRRWKNAPGTQRGWDIGLLSSADFGDSGLSTFAYQVKVPRFFLGPRHVKVALAWTSSVASIFDWFYLSSLQVDLDLKVFDASGNQVGYSGSWDNSYEVVEFTGAPGATYTIRVRRWSGTRATWFGIAWTVTGGLRISLPAELGDLLLSRG